MNDHLQLMNNNQFVLTEYSNRLNHIRNSMKLVRLPLIVRLNKHAIELMHDLKEEFNLNDKAEVNRIYK